MIKIRYTELPGGLYARAEAWEKDTIIYLQHGLTASQRSAALTRLRRWARLGQGPPLAAAGLARARAADRIRVNLRSAVAALLMHPLRAALSLLLLLSVAALFVLSAQAPGGSPAQVAPPQRAPLSDPSLVVPDRRPVASGQLQRQHAGGAAPAGRSVPGITPAADSGPASTAGTGSRGPAAQPRPTGTAQTAKPAPSPSPQPSPSDPDQSRSSDGDGGLC